MTTREFYNAVISANVSEEITSYATAAIQKMDAQNETRRTSMTPTKRENEKLKGILLDKMDVGAPYTAVVAGELLGVSSQKASALLRQLTADEYVEVTEQKIEGRKVKAYTKYNEVSYTQKSES